MIRILCRTTICALLLSSPAIAVTNNSTRFYAPPSTRIAPVRRKVHVTAPPTTSMPQAHDNPNRPREVESAPLEQTGVRTKLDFKDTQIGGDRYIPKPISVPATTPEEQPGLIGLRLRWTPEMVNSASLALPY